VKSKLIYLLILVMLLTGRNAHSQGKLAFGIDIEPLLCFTDLAPRLDGLERTSPKHWDLFNYRLGLHGDLQLESGPAITTGVDFSRKRFGFVHDQELMNDIVSLWGHSEYYTYSFPLDISYPVYTDTDPFYSIMPFIGISAGQDISDYRNLSRLDQNTEYIYWFDRSDYQKSSFVATARAGVRLRTVIDQLGLIDWHITFASDITRLPVFSYEIITADGTMSYNQKLRMNYISFGMTMHFKSWEIVNGNLLRERYK